MRAAVWAAPGAVCSSVGAIRMDGDSHDKGSSMRSLRPRNACGSSSSYGIERVLHLEARHLA